MSGVPLHHPAGRAVTRGELRREIREWAAGERRRVGPAAADRLIDRLTKLCDPEPDTEPVPNSVVVAMAGYRDRDAPRHRRQ